MGEEKERWDLKLDQTELSVMRSEQSSRISRRVAEGQDGEMVVGRKRQTAHVWSSLHLENAVCKAVKLRQLRGQFLLIV